MLGMHMVPATVMATDAKTGIVDVATESMAPKVHSPSSAMTGLKAGNEITWPMGCDKP